jgi:hypothetical protein
MDDSHRTVFVVQIKAYVTPTNMIDVQRAEREIRHAITQCEIADANHDAVRRAVENRFSSRLHDGWQLRQIIVAEAIVGVVSSPSYPVVTTEWFESEGCRVASRSLHAAWDAARRLPDGASFFAAVRPVFALYSGLPSEVGPVAVFGHET